MGGCCPRPHPIKVDIITRLSQSQKVVMFSRTDCPLCDDAKALLAEEGITYGLLELDECPDIAKKLVGHTNYNALPQIFIGGKMIGGLCALHHLRQKKKLKMMISRVKTYLRPLC